MQVYFYPWQNKRNWLITGYMCISYTISKECALRAYLFLMFFFLVVVVWNSGLTLLPVGKISYWKVVSKCALFSHYQLFITQSSTTAFARNILVPGTKKTYKTNKMTTVLTIFIVRFIFFFKVGMSTFMLSQARWREQYYVFAPLWQFFFNSFPDSYHQLQHQQIDWRHDARILQNSTFYQIAEQGDILADPAVDVDGHEIRAYWLGDGAYLIFLWLQKPFLEATRDQSEIQFNQELFSGRVKVECAFGCLKSRKKILHKHLDSVIAFSFKTAIAWVLLHNVCIKMGDDWDDNGNPHHRDCHHETS